jgi:LPXTG-motif cell wall-anchored protein
VINFAPHSFRAKTADVDETGDITITLAISGDPQVTDDFGSVSVTTLAKKLPNTGIDTFATVAAGALAAVAGLAAISVVALRRRSSS